MDTSTGGRLVFLLTADGVPPGVLTWDAWQAARSAGEVLAVEPDPTWVQAFDQAAVAVRELPRSDARTLARRLVGEARERGQAVWLVTDDDGAVAREVTALMAASAADVEVEVLVGAYERPGSRVLDLVAVMDRLRSPGGCPWDAEQTHASLVPYALEEAYEVAEAVESGDKAALREELGDLLLQVVFHARVAAEDAGEPFDVDDVAAGIVAKLRRRHPHVFAAGSASTAAEVETSWEAIKADEKGRASVLDGVPLAMPSLARAQKLLGRIQRAGLPGALAPVDVDDLGAHLLGVVAGARAAGLDAETALRQAVRDAEAVARAAGSAAGRATGSAAGTGQASGARTP